MIKHLLPFLAFIGLISCLEPFDFESESYEKILVVEGIITNEAKSHSVKLSYTYPLDSGNSLSKITNATVYIENELGQRENFYDEGNGIYKSQVSFKGTFGEKYKLTIITPDDRQYESKYEQLIAAPPIDSIYSQYAELPSNETNQNEGGIQFFLDSHDDTETAKFFRFQYEETYQIRVPFPSRFDVSSGVLVERTKPVGVCYRYDTSQSVIIGTTVNSLENRLSELPLVYIPQSSQQLRSRYSILTKQHVISENAYLYYRKLKENNESSGSLFDKQSGTIVGNITSVDTPNEPVLGYFEVSGVSQLRAFFSPRDFDERFNPASFPYICSLLDAETFELNAGVEYVNSSYFKQIYDINPTTNPDARDSVYVFSQTCTSCDWYADTSVPEFWIE